MSKSFLILLFKEITVSANEELFMTTREFFILQSAPMFDLVVLYLENYCLLCWQIAIKIYCTLF